MEFYDDLIDSSHIQMFMVQSCLLLRGGQENQSEGTPLPSGGGVINPVLALYTLTNSMTSATMACKTVML